MNVRRELGIIGKWLDQPALINKISGKIPAVLGVSAAGYGIYDTFNNKKVKEGKETELQRGVKNACVLGFTVVSALIFGKKFIHHPHIHPDEIDDVMRSVNKPEIKELLGRVKDGVVLKRKEIGQLFDSIKDRINRVIPTGHHHDNEFAEIKDLSILGTIPVLGGIAGGIAGDALTGEDPKKTVPNKIKEGSYQYLANIVLCNVGAGAALFAVNRTPFKENKPVKFFGMLAGILAVGVAGGSFLANKFGKHVVDPLVGHHHHHQGRKPEALDIGLHIDDVASAGFLSGLNIIGPALPVLYSISGYRAGIGYRNEEHHSFEEKFHEKCREFHLVP